jgi:hypothetical protein
MDERGNQEAVSPSTERTQPEILFPANALWPWMRDVTEAECRSVIERYHGGDESVCALRWGSAADKFGLTAMLEGRRLKIQVQFSEEENRYLVISAYEV